MYLYLLFIILFLLLLLIIIFAALLYIYPVKIAATFNSDDQTDIHFLASWISPFIKVFITRHSNKTSLDFRLFNKTVLRKELGSKETKHSILKSTKFRNYLDLVKYLGVISAKIHASYGFNDPSITGILCGAIGLISNYINLDELDNNPNFITDTNYFNIAMESEINGFISIMKILRRKLSYSSSNTLLENK